MKHSAANLRNFPPSGDIAPATGLWHTTSEIAYLVCAFLVPAALCAQAIRQHWAIENRLHYVSDTSFREDASRIRCNAGSFARLRSLAANILRLQQRQNVSDARYRIAVGGQQPLSFTYQIVVLR